MHLFVLAVLFSLSAEAQQINPLKDINVDDLGNVDDAFQESFFEALKQKGIENYDRAIKALDVCIAMRPEEAILYFEKAKNYAAQGNTSAAETNYLKALELRPKQQDLLEGLYEVYHATQDYKRALSILDELVEYDSQYIEDKVRIYLQIQEVEKALALLDELDDELGQDEFRTQLRKQAYALSDGDLREKLLNERIAVDPQNPENYLNLIYVYSEEGKTQKAYETAQRLQQFNPEADAVHLALYKFNLEKGEVETALKSLERALKSDQLEAQLKHSVLNDFLIYTKANPQFEPQLDDAITWFSNWEDVDLNEELAAYYLKQKDSSKALEYLAKAYANTPEDFTTIKQYTLLLIESAEFQKAATVAASGLEIYPTQPILYLLNGVANNNSGNHKEAITALETGLDYLLVDPQMEADFYKQLSDSYTKSGNAQKASDYLKRAKALMQ